MSRAERLRTMAPEIVADVTLYAPSERGRCDTDAPSRAWPIELPGCTDGAAPSDLGGSAALTYCA